MIRRLFEPPYQGLLWLVCLAVILGSHPHDWLVTVRILPSAPSAAMATDGIWHPPLARWSTTNELGEWPFVIVAGILAAVVTMVIQPAALPLGSERVAAAIGLSLIAEPTELVAALSLALIATALRCDCDQHERTRTLLVIAATALAILGSLEFGLILLLAACVLLSDLRGSQPEKSRWRTWPIVGVVTLVIAVAALTLLIPGFHQAALRPVNWIWLQPPSGLMPSLAPSFTWTQGLVAITSVLPLWCLGWLTLLRTRVSYWLILFWVASVILAVCCRRYLFLAALANAVPLVMHPHLRFSLGRPRVVLSLCLALACVRAGLLTDGMALISGESTQVVQPAEWDVSGLVVLLNLDQSSTWRARLDSDQLPLLIDDRWDILSNHYREFAVIRRDLRDVRDHPYLRTDGQWGGYRAWMEEWSPTLLAVAVDNVEAIRSLSLSPEWKIMSVDGDFAIFGRIDDPQSLRQMQRAIESLLNLEWPVRPIGNSLANTIVAANDADDIAVAGAICAMRFPYAGLRFLVDDAGFDARRVRAWCYLELAHRVAQHSSTASLLDQTRAVVLAREILDNFRLGDEERDRLQRSLETLGTSPARIPAPVDANLEPEEQLRIVLLHGDVEAANKQLNDVPDQLKPFYAALIESPKLTDVEIVSALQAVIAGMSDDVPAELRSEAQFYLGCAALEAGDTLTALIAFTDSEASAPDSPFREIRSVYIGQLTR